MFALAWKGWTSNYADILRSFHFQAQTSLSIQNSRRRYNKKQKLMHFNLLGLLFVSDQWVAAWQPNAILFVLLQQDHFFPNQSPGWYRYSFGVFFSSQTETYFFVKFFIRNKSWNSGRDFIPNKWKMTLRVLFKI